jgi:uncharacterized protein YchJ
MYTTAKEAKALAAHMAAMENAPGLGISARGEVGAVAVGWVARFRSHGAAQTAMEKAGFVRVGGLWFVASKVL